MRLWSLHPYYLDSKGLLAVWREGLLGLKALQMGEYIDLQGRKRIYPYYNHPQLERFKRTVNPVTFIRYYLESIWIESKERGYKFNRDLIQPKVESLFVPEIFIVTKGQLYYEFKHLQKKLWLRHRAKYWLNEKIIYENKIEANPLFKVVEGGIADWEKI